MSIHPRFPWMLVIAAGLLAALGCLGIDRAEDLAGGSGRYLRQQAVWAVLATAALGLAAAVSYRRVVRWAPLLFPIALVLLLLVDLYPPINGARRWIRLGPIGMQPSEFAKVVYVLTLAAWLAKKGVSRWRDLAMPLGLTILPGALILKEPDLGTALLFPPTLLAMLYAAGARRRQLAALAGIGALLVPVVWSVMSREQQSRVTALFEQAGPGEAAASDTYQLRQAKQVLLLGRVWGSVILGPVVDDPGAYHLPEARSDFILAMIGERLGLPGVALVLLLHGLLAAQGVRIAAAAEEPLGRLLACGVTALIAVQTTINAGMAVGLLPVTGVSLPLVSYGGSGLVSFGLALGLVVNVALRPGLALER